MDDLNEGIPKPSPIHHSREGLPSARPGFTVSEWAARMDEQTVTTPTPPADSVVPPLPEQGVFSPTSLWKVTISDPDGTTTIPLGLFQCDSRITLSNYIKRTLSQERRDWTVQVLMVERAPDVRKVSGATMRDADRLRFLDTEIASLKRKLASFESEYEDLRKGLDIFW